MSTLVEALPTLNNNTHTHTHLPSSNIIKDQERSNDEDIAKNEQSELRENTDDIAHDLSKEIISSSKKEGHSDNVNVGTELKETHTDASFTSNVQTSLEKHDDKEEDGSLSNEEEKIGRSIGVSSVGGEAAEVQILSLSVISPGRADVVLPIPFPATTSKATLFSLKEGSKYRIKFHLTVSNATVHNLKYTYMVWKSGIRVHQTKKMVGTFRPREEAYVYELEEGTTPTGFFARGPFFVRSKFVDDDDKCYLDTTYYFDIRKDWGANK